MYSAFMSTLHTWSTCPRSVKTLARLDLSYTSSVLFSRPATRLRWSHTRQLTPSPQRRSRMPRPATTQLQKSFSMTSPVVSQVTRPPRSQWRLCTGPLCPVRERRQPPSCSRSQM